MNRINYELKKVENGPMGKLFRTLGYLLILFSASYFALKNLVALDIGLINGFVNPALDFFNKELEVLVDFWQLILVSGILIIIWPLSKKKTLPIFTTIFIFVAIFINNQLYAENGIVPFLNVPEIKVVTDLFIEFNWLQLAIYLVPLLFVYTLIGLKKPKRIASSLLSGALLVLIFAMIADTLPVLLNNDWHTKALFVKIIAGVFGLSFVLQALASLFGILGFMRK